MQNLKNLFFTMAMLLLTVIFFTVTVPVNGYTAEDDLTFNDEDAKTMKTGDYDAVADVLYKLADIYDARGKVGLKPAVPHLIEAAKKELRIPEDERWNLVDIVKILSMTGDERTKPMLLEIMSVMWGGGTPFTSQGFLDIGHSTVKDVADSLKSPNSVTRGRAALTLHKMFELDESGEFFTPEDHEMIKKLLLANIDYDDVNVRIYTVVAMRSFGDDSVISTLEHIERHDAHKDSGGTYEVRIEATETLKKLRDK